MRKLPLFLFVFMSFTFGQEIANTSFEEPEVLYPDSEYVDVGDPGENHALQNNNEQPIVNYESIGGELGFQSYYYNTRNSAGLTDGDYIGLTNNLDDVGTYSDGSQGFVISDADGYMVTTLDTLDITGYNSVLVTLDYFLVETGWENNDVLRIWLVLDGTIELDLINTEGTDIDSLAIEGSWMSISQKVIGYKKLNVKFGLDCNAETEALYIDNIHIYENLSPVIREYANSKIPPLSNEIFKDTVQIFDIGGSILNATLHYSINSGDTSNVEMTKLDYDSLYTAEISDTEYYDDDQVDYWVSAMDDESTVTVGKTHGFFAGFTEISIFKQWQDDTELLYDSYYVRTTGVATVGDSVFSKNHMNFYIQDDMPTAVKVFQYDAAEIEIIPGHRYTVIGKITQNGGMLEVRPDNPAIDVIDDGEAYNIPYPIEIEIASLLSGGELLEGLLVRCSYVDTIAFEDNDPWPSNTENDAYKLVSDDGGISQLILHLDKDTDIPGMAEPSWPQHITGIFGQYDEFAPYTEGYQLIPRSINDFEVAGAISEPSNTMIPDELILYAAYPNPFNLSTTIQFNIPIDMVGEKTKKVTIYNTIGQAIKIYNLSNVKAGLSTINWNGYSNEGNLATSGLYFVVLRINNIQQTTKLLLLK